MAEANVTVYGGSAAPTLLGQGPARIPTGGKIRAGIKVLTRKAAEHPQARALYEQGVAAGQSFEQWQARGMDAGSIIADPGFVDPERGDFRFNPGGGPVKSIGF